MITLENVRVKSTSNTKSLKRRQKQKKGRRPRGRRLQLLPHMVGELYLLCASKTANTTPCEKIPNVFLVETGVLYGGILTALRCQVYNYHSEGHPATMCGRCSRAGRPQGRAWLSFCAIAARAHRSMRSLGCALSHALTSAVTAAPNTAVRGPFGPAAFSAGARAVAAPAGFGGYGGVRHDDHKSRLNPQ